MIMDPAVVLLFSFCCVALFSFLFSIHQNKLNLLERGGYKNSPLGDGGRYEKDKDHCSKKPD